MGGEPGEDGHTYMYSWVPLPSTGNYHHIVNQLCAVLSCFSHVQLCATQWTTARQAPLFMGFSRQEYWSGLPCPPPGDIPDPGIKPASLRSPALAGEVFTTSAPQPTPREALISHAPIQNKKFTKKEMWRYFFGPRSQSWESKSRAVSDPGLEHWGPFPLPQLQSNMWSFFLPRPLSSHLHHHHQHSSHQMASFLLQPKRYTLLPNKLKAASSSKPIPAAHRTHRQALAQAIPYPSWQQLEVVY